MGEFKIDRVITRALEKSIGLRGVREEDEFTLDLFQDRERTFRLKRFKYTIKSSHEYSFDFVKAEIHLPVFENDSSEYELVLINQVGCLNYNENSRYLLRSLGRMPFKHNGVQSFEAFLERGDVVEIGFNRIHFLRPNSHLKLAEENIVLTEQMITSTLNILIEGETGTGKTTMARMIHEESKRSGSFVHLNLSSFSPSLIESELFGHAKGAFTGAITEKKGAILEANKGTLFLDEIDSLNIELQTKLLLFLDNQEFRAVGGNRVQKAQVRLIFASGSKIKKLIEENRMRQDFYFRLTSGVVISLDSLRVNPKKIRELCADFEKKNYCVISEDLIDFYEQCLWPGNIRQLNSHLYKKRILANGKKLMIDKSDYDLLQEKASLDGYESNQIRSLEMVKLNYCLNVFNKMNKNYSKSAKLLSISPNTLKAILRASVCDEESDLVDS